MGGGNPSPDLRVYLDVGTREGLRSGTGPAAFVADTARMADLLSRQGNDLVMRVAGGAEHDETAWRRRFPVVLRCFLEGMQPVP